MSHKERTFPISQFKTVTVLFAIWILMLTGNVGGDAILANDLLNNEIESLPTTLPTVTSEEAEEQNVTKRKSSNKPFLLPQVIIPSHYRLEIIPLLFEPEDEDYSFYNVTKFSAPGKVWIEFKCLEDTSNVTLHAHKDVSIVEETLTITNLGTNETISIKNISRENDTDFLIIHLANNMTNSSNEVYVLYIEFLSKIADDRLNGIYLDYYVDPTSKEKRYLSTTLFAPNHARKAFPCFDEPGFKTKFSISIGRKNNSGYTSISNMPLLTTKALPEISGWVWDVFEDSLPLPTYLVALITTDFQFRSVHHGDIEVRLHAPAFLLERTRQLNLTKDNVLQKNQNPYILQDPLIFIENALEMWKDTGLGKYPLSKLDVIALPHFYFNAMENMGAMTFKYPVILNVEKVTTTSELLRMNYVAGHEVVHQWFGNMLTPKSWTYVWLKESFSDLYSQIFISKKLYGKYNPEDMLTTELQKAMEYDSGPDTHPLENQLKSASSVGEIYTHIPYRKGASIMQMTKFVMGEKSFKNGLESLFLEKKYSTIDQYDLFDHLDKAQEANQILASQGLNANITITDILNPWTKQSGYPVVRVRRDGLRVILKQEQYKNGLLKLLNDKESEEATTTEQTVEENPTDKRTDDEKYWWIPVKVSYADNTSTGHRHQVQWLPPNDTETIILEEEHSHVSISNVEGYFRILYSKEELLSVLKNLMRPYHTPAEGFPAYSFNGQERGSLFTPVETSQLVDDYFSFAFSNYEEVPISTLFHILSTILPYDGNHVVWKTFLTNMWKPYQLLQNTEFFGSFQNYLINLLRPIYSFLQSQANSILTAPCSYGPAVTKRMKFTQFRSLIFSWLCRLGAEECLVASNEVVAKFMETGVIPTLQMDTQQSNFCTVIRTAPDAQLETLWAFFEKSYFDEGYSVQRDRYLKALSCTTKPEYLERLLTWTINATLDFHDIDRVTLFKCVIANPKGREVILDFLDKNFDSLYKSASVANPVTEGLKAYVEYVNSNSKLEEVEKFIENHSSAMEQKKKSLQKQVRTAKLNILWVDLFASDIGKSLDHLMKNKLDFTNQEVCPPENESDFESYLTSITDWV